MVHVEVIKDSILKTSFQKFDSCMDFVMQLEYPIVLNSYSYYLRVALNTLQSDRFDYLLTLLNSNTELESNQGGYSINFLGENNPKKALADLLLHLKIASPKNRKILEYIQAKTKAIIVSDSSDIDFLNHQFLKQNQKVQILTFKTLKKELNKDFLRNKLFMFYSFNGKKDFEFIYNLSHETVLILGSRP